LVGKDPGLARTLGCDVRVFFPNQVRLVFEPDDTAISRQEIKREFQLLQITTPIKNSVLNPLFVLHRFSFDFYDRKNLAISLFGTEYDLLFFDFEGCVVVSHVRSPPNADKAFGSGWDFSTLNRDYGKKQGKENHLIFLRLIDY
jgi:hypothetical protein